MESNLQILLKEHILCKIIEYVGSIKYCIFTFSSLFKELDGECGYDNITKKIKDIFIHHIYKNVYIDFFRPIRLNQNSIDRLHKIICSKKGVSCEELSLLYAEQTVLYLTTLHADNYWFSNAIEEYYYINGIYINEYCLIKFDFDHDNYPEAKINWHPIHNILLDHLDKTLYRFHIDEMTISHTGEDTTILDDFYSDELHKVLTIVNVEDNTQFDYIANYYKYDNKVMFWALLGLIFTIGEDYKDNPKKRDLLLKQCIIILYSRYFNNTMLLTYNTKISDIFLNCTFINTQFGSIFEFLEYFNNTYPTMAVDLEVNSYCSLLDFTH